MSEWTLKHRRDDGTFVIDLRGLPYHVVKEDPLFADVAAAAEGVDLPPEPPAVAPAPPAAPAPQPTDSVPRADYEALLRRVAALESKA